MFVPVGTEEREERKSFPIATSVLVGINLLVFLFEVYLYLSSGDQALNAFITNFGVQPAAILNRQSAATPYYLTPLTAMFVHGSLTHVGFNMLYLLAFGDNIEDRLGRLKYVVFYLLSGFIATGLHVILNPNSQVPTVGASGAIAGVLAGYLVLFPKGEVRMFLFLGPLSRTTRIKATLYIGFWFVLQFFNGLGVLDTNTAETQGVAYWAHIGGFVAGLLLAFLYKNVLDSSSQSAWELQDQV